MKTPYKCRGVVEPITLIIIITCLCVGGYFALRSKVIDSPVEQGAEAILKAEGIDIDFSAEKKKDANVPQIPCTPD